MRACRCCDPAMPISIVSPSIIMAMISALTRPRHFLLFLREVAQEGWPSSRRNRSSLPKTPLGRRTDGPQTAKVLVEEPRTAKTVENVPQRAAAAPPPRPRSRRGSVFRVSPNRIDSLSPVVVSCVSHSCSSSVFPSSISSFWQTAAVSSTTSGCCGKAKATSPRTAAS